MTEPRFAFDRLVHKGRVAELHSVGVRMPDGRVVPRDFVHYAGAAVILPVLSDGRFVFIRNWRFAVEEHLLELPAGMVDAPESPEAGALRELSEETGCIAGRIERLGSFFSAPGSTDENMHAFLATELTEGRQHLENYEQIEVVPLPEGEVRAMVLDGRIHDAKTIAALCLYWLKKGR